MHPFRRLCLTTRAEMSAHCEARAAREAARLAVGVAAATTVLDECGTLVCRHRARIGTLRFTFLRRGRLRTVVNSILAVVAWAA